MERELTALEHRLYKFLDDVDSIVEFMPNDAYCNKLRNKVQKCKQDCQVEFGVVNNGYSLHIKLPFDVDSLTTQRRNT